jgi:hypothetical protein
VRLPNCADFVAFQNREIHKHSESCIVLEWFKLHLAWLPKLGG